MGSLGEREDRRVGWKSRGGERSEKRKEAEIGTRRVGRERVIVTGGTAVTFAAETGGERLGAERLRGEASSEGSLVRLVAASSAR